MRIVGGSFKGRRLKAFHKATIRPTTDMVRESIFNIIASFLPAGSVADLFAGTGALGIEALSRGAERVDFVDSDPQAAFLIQGNLDLLGVTDSAKLVTIDTVTYLKGVARKKQKLDIIFMDPPYESGLADITLSLIDRLGVLSPGGIVVVETSARTQIDATLNNLEETAAKRYGDSAVHIFKARGG